MIKVAWDVEKLVALIDVYRKSDGKITEQIEKLGIKHDEKFRNVNGMKMMFQNVVYMATNGHQGLSSVSSSLQKVYKMLHTNPDVFELILKEFAQRYNLKQ